MIVGIILLILVAVWLIGKRFKFWEKMGRPTDNSDYSFFKMSEFDSPAMQPNDSGKETYTHHGRQYLKNSGKENMKKSFLEMLELARLNIDKGWNQANKTARIVFSINSGYRTPHYNDTPKSKGGVGGATKSAHKTGRAVDIKTTGYTDEQRKEILKELYKVGFRRFGIGKTFIHVDNESNNPTPAVWNYNGGGYSLSHYEIEDIAAL